MSAMLERAFPRLPLGRAARLAYFEEKRRVREAADPLHDFKTLYAWANFSAISRLGLTLSEHHELIRRACVLRAWCAFKLGWSEEFRNALRQAATEHRLARAAHKEGR